MYLPLTIMKYDDWDFVFMLHLGYSWQEICAGWALIHLLNWKGSVSQEVCYARSVGTWKGACENRSVFCTWATLLMAKMSAPTEIEKLDWSLVKIDIYLTVLKKLRPSFGGMERAQQSRSLRWCWRDLPTSLSVDRVCDDKGHAC